MSKKLTKKQRTELKRRLSNWVKATRKLHNIKQGELADMLGLNQSAMSRVEAGTQELLGINYFYIKEKFKVVIEIDSEVGE